jgi:hypothetical protein
MKRTLEIEEFEALTNAIQAFDSEVTDYSGRGMYDRRCVGFSVDSEKQAIRVLIFLAASNQDLAEDLADDYCTESLGKGIIVYFPSFSAPVIELGTKEDWDAGTGAESDVFLSFLRDEAEFNSRIENGNIYD